MNRFIFNSFFALVISSGLVLACSSSSSGDGSSGNGSTTSGGDGGSSSGGNGSSGNNGSGGSGSSGSHITTSVDGSKKFGDLSSAEKAQLCQDLKQSIFAASNKDQFNRAYCAMNAVGDMDMDGATNDVDAKATCQASYQECMNSDPDPFDDPDVNPQDCAAIVPVDATNCTVSLYIACENELWDQSVAAAAWSCDQAKAGEEPSFYTDLTPNCEAFGSCTLESIGGTN